MTLKLTLAQIAAPRAFVRALAVCVSLALAAALGCGGGGSQTPILDSAEYAVTMDVSALLASSEIPALTGSLGIGLPSDSLLEDPAEWKEELRDDYEDLGFEPADSISSVARVSYAGSASYSYVGGGFDFAAYRNKLDDDGAEEGGYRGFEVWDSGSRTRAILEDRELAVVGDEEAVKDVLKAFDRGEGFANETDPLKRALDKTGGGLVARASANCQDAAIFRFSSSACKAVAESVKGGDAGKTEIVGVYLFSSERRAQSGLDDVEDLLHEANMDADFEEIKADGEFVTYRATIYAP